MKMRNVRVLFATIALLAFPAMARADQFLADFRGYDYEDPNGGAGFGDLGDGYNSLGLVTQVNTSLLTANFVANEYTYQFKDLTAIGSESAPPFLYLFYSPGRFRIYEDSRTLGTMADYDTPLTFVDGGALILGGSVTNFVIQINTTNNNGAFTGDIAFDEGLQQGSIPAAQLNGWTFAGLTSGGGTGTPAGYVHQVDGEIRVPDVVAAQAKSWGQVKSLYRH